VRDRGCSGISGEKERERKENDGEIQMWERGEREQVLDGRRRKKVRCKFSLEIVYWDRNPLKPIGQNKVICNFANFALLVLEGVIIDSRTEPRSRISLLLVNNEHPSLSNERFSLISLVNDLSHLPYEERLKILKFPFDEGVMNSLRPLILTTPAYFYYALFYSPVVMDMFTYFGS
jgi:hypothetical protein